VQFFGNCRVNSFVTRARARDGEVTRVFSFLLEKGEVLAKLGEQTSEEARLRFVNLSGVPLSAALARISEPAQTAACRAAGVDGSRAFGTASVVKGQ